MRVEIELEPDVYERLSSRAQAESVPLGDVIARVFGQSQEGRTRPGSIVGLFAAEGDLIEAVCEEAMRDRERMPMRMPDAPGVG